MPRTGTLNQAEKQSIVIDNFIFHVIIKGEAAPTYLSDVELEPGQRKFFCDRIADAAEGTQYKFKDKAKDTAANCCQILDDPTKNFLASSRDIADSFLKLHIGNVNNGAFIVAKFHIQTAGNNVPLVALIKVDHKKVIQYDVKSVDGKNVAKMKEILNSFIESKSAVQKCAIVEPGDYFSWDVLAKDRSSTIGVTDYFKSFLSVVELENPTYWTEKAVSAVNQWAKGTADLPEHARNYRARAAQYMETHNAFDTDSFLDMVVMDDDQDRKEKLSQSLKAELVNVGVDGQRFAPAPSVVKKYSRSTVYTAEGVTIQWVGTDKTANLSIGEPDQNGIITIEIKTQQVIDKSKL